LWRCSAELSVVKTKFCKSEFECRHYALYALMSIYGVELLADNLAECRDNMLEASAIS
jgi:hypothetical protein